MHIDSSGASYYGLYKVYHSITADADWEVTSVWLDAIYLNIADNALLKIYLDEGGDPDSGTLVGTSDTIALAVSPGTEETFTFVSPAILVNGLSYFLVFEPVDPTKAIYLFRTAASVYAGGGLGYYDGATWTDNEAYYDARQLKIYGYL